MKKQSVVAIGSVLLFSTLYAVTRYHVFGDVPLKDLPLFVSNKVFALSAFVILTITFALGPARTMGAEISPKWMAIRKETGVVGFILVMAHIVCSLSLLSPVYYGKFFRDDGSFNAIGSWSLLLGALSFVWIWAYNFTFRTHQKSDDQESDDSIQRLISSKASLLIIMVVSALHVAIMGFNGWMTPGEWPGGMPPISLVAFAVFVFGFAINLRGRK